MKSPGKPDPIRDDELEALICDCLDMLLPKLPAEQANVVRAVDVEGALLQSVADSQGLSLNEVTTYLVLGRKGLKEQFGLLHMVCLQHGLAGCDCHLKGEPGT